MAVVGILPAAGSGERLGASGPKAFALCGGRPLLDWSLDVLESVCDRVVVAVPAGYDEGVDRVVGGASRSASVRAALAAAPEATVAVVHDAARPLVSDELVERVVTPLSQGWDGAVPGLAVVDTVKRVGPDGAIVETVPRGELVAVQTPQAFVADVLRRALASESASAATDCASLVEAQGGRVQVVDGDPRLLKVTSPEDLALVESWLAA